jgi:predicted deacylase
MHTAIVHSLDFQQEGRQSGFLGIPFSVDRSPYYQIKIPYTRLRNGDGPRVLLMAGNHGDEYEGELLLAKLSRVLGPATLRGAVTILPIVNAPAVLAHRRRSPHDGGNLNRAFPGDPAGTPTFKLAWFLEHVLFPQHDVVFDLHSGGTSMAHLLTALIERHEDPAVTRRATALMRATGMPYGFIALNGADAPTSMAAAARAGAIGVSGEFGGGGTTTPESMRRTARAIDGLLMAAGCLSAPVLSDGAAMPEMRLLALESHDQAIYATRPGWFQPAAMPGDRVDEGQVAGWYHDLNDIGRPEEELHFGCSGIVLSQRLHTHCEGGDCLVQVARLLPEE